MAEQTSCMKPGRVSSIEREPPPMVSLASRTSTDRPARANVIAAASPLGPAPTTIASYEGRLDINALIPYCSFLPGLSNIPPIVRQHGCIYKYRSSSRFVFQYPQEC